MPANLTPEYKQAEEKFRQAKTPEEKLICLEEMLATIPKHKGTEKMQADIKSRIARIRRELSEDRGSGKRVDWYSVEKQGAGQIAVFGAPNCGKSALVHALTGLNTEVAPYPFTTTRPLAGMMPYEDIQIQLIDTPPLTPDSPAWLFHILRTADAVCWLLDLGDDSVLETTEQIRELLARHRIAFTPEPGTTIKPLLRLGTKADDPEAQDRLTILRELMGDVDILLVSVNTGQGIEEFRRRAFAVLDIIRVYTKKPGKPPDMNEPVILKTGATVIDAAYHLHKDFARKLAYARLWRNHAFTGQRVERTQCLQDRDIIEFHIQE
ncbi:MAG: 50S ribosome-binding GTPase [candidate division WOR-3 bacterium]|uniref:TGS domain-containing protein n=1 Tax=candidate division WOR-3 bacterium TaxID=2052148 RepID=A0A7C1X1B9_UNCW3|nr:50S ribosome-binding GTPase [candidate division WOR-3 bacterium]